MPEGNRNPAALDTTKTGRLCINSGCSETYRVRVRAMASKFPGTLMSGYQAAENFAMTLTGMDQYKMLMKDFIKRKGKTAQDKYDALNKQYNFTSGVPYFRLYVNLAKNTTQDRRDFISNGIRSFFKDDFTVMLDMKDVEKNVQSSLVLFNIFVGIVGCIALIVAFFLLLVSTTSNIKENVWEYGCLRAIGLSQG
jgi:ABC-type antimicrobial peptide transport system permease subunit